MFGQPESVGGLAILIFDYIVTISFGYILYSVLTCNVVVIPCFVMSRCVYVCVL